MSSGWVLGCLLGEVLLFATHLLTVMMANGVMAGLTFNVFDVNNRFNDAIVLTLICSNTCAIKLIDVELRAHH